MTAAIFGLLGVVTGAALTAFAELALEHRRERRALRLAARLVHSELGLVRQTLKWDRDDDAEMPLGPYREHALAAGQLWGEHRAVLAAGVDSVTWGAISRAASNIAVAGMSTEDTVVDPEVLNELDDVFKHALSRLAKYV